MKNLTTDEVIKNIIVHYSLLPAFPSDDPVRDAILAGVKVTGVTLTYNDKIVAQYPIFITNDMHYDELKMYLEYIENIMTPLVAKKIANNEAFEIQALMSSQKCEGKCGGKCGDKCGDKCSGNCEGCKN